MATALALALLIAACGRSQGSGTEVPATGLDHILVGTPDLDSAVETIARRTGVRPMPGGSHPGVGTRNALLSLGSGAYLEIIAPDPAQKPADFGKFVAGLRGPTPLGWALHTADLTALHGALRARGIRVEPIMPGSRVRPDGRSLRWRTFEIGPEEDVSPFFIQWGKGSVHPSADAPKGCRLDRMRVGGPINPNVRKALQITHQDAVLQPKASAGLHFSLVCPGGSMAF